MVYENVGGTYKKVNGIYQNVGGITKEINKRYENIGGILKKVYHPWILVKNGKLVNKFHLCFVNTYANVMVDLPDYSNLYEDEDGVWLELTKRYTYTGYLVNSTRFLLCISVPCSKTLIKADEFVMASTYRSINYSINYKSTLWGMFPFQAGSPGRREDYHLDTTSYLGTFTNYMKLEAPSTSEQGAVGDKHYITLVGIQQMQYGRNHTVNYNSFKICIKELYALIDEKL